MPGPTGPAVRLYPCALPDGEGVSVSVNQYGQIGFHNDRGLLVLTVPLAAVDWVLARFSAHVHHGPARRVCHEGATVADFWIRLTPGARAALPLGALGELAIEAA